LSLKGRVVPISYLIVVASAAYLLIPSLLPPYGNYPYGGGSLVSFLFPGGLILNVMAVAGMILGPYFGLAGLIAKDKSIWVEVNRMLHTHISFPVIGGLVLFYGSIFLYGFLYFLLPVYVLFVCLATLITVMASRTSKSASITPAPAGTNLVQ